VPELLSENQAVTVLVIDDDAPTREVISRYLRRDGFMVATAENGVTGLQVARTVKPDVITLDIKMPDIDGWTVLEELKADEELRQIPVILISIIDERSRGFALGASEYLVKPVDRDILLETVNKYRKAECCGHILIVEDDLPTREMMKRALSRAGWTVAEAENGHVALVQVKQNLPDLILLDLMMPEMDGFTFMAELHKHSEWLQIPIIVVTAKDLTAAEQQRLEGNVERVIEKGAFSREALLNEIQKLVQLHIIKS
ncbi:MAG: response regulator, partial [Anaerolineae bacterium]|nr:response regulator [Anaerolineae bacterium]